MVEGIVARPCQTAGATPGANRWSGVRPFEDLLPAKELTAGFAQNVIFRRLAAATQSMLLACFR